MIWAYVDCIIDGYVLILGSYDYADLIAICTSPIVDLEKCEENGQSLMLRQERLYECEYGILIPL